MTSSPKGTSVTSPAISRLGPIDVLLLSAWCGLAAGELEVASRVISRNLGATNGLYLMMRHFIWLVPLIDMSVFLALGLLLAMATRFWPRRAGWLGPRLLFAWAILPALLLAGRGIYTEALIVLALGFASLVTPVFERDPARMRRYVALSFPLLLAAVIMQGLLLVGGDWLKRRREEARPLPPPGSPNVLLIVLDTVRADHLGVYGYERPTSPNLDQLARRSIRFEQARSAAPWTLASHATMFTARWPHELDVKWLQPMSRKFPTLAEYLGSLGYATAGFVGNTYYCAYDSGLDRGFTHYEDYVLETLPAIRTARLVDLWFKSLAQLGESLPTNPLVLQQITREDRKEAREVNREFLEWLKERRQPERPFFAFLNYVDAHAPYVLPAGSTCRFGSVPTPAEILFLLKGWFEADKQRLPQQARVLARDSYDNCLAYLDERLGELLDELERRGVTDRTIVIVTADHGEGLGEHDLFDHGESLYRTEIRVPLLIALPTGGPSKKVVGEPVSLRNIASTIVNLVDPGSKPPFAGAPLTSAWGDVSGATSPTFRDDPILSELESPNPGHPNQDRSPSRLGPLSSLAEGAFVYIRNESDGSEQLFDEQDDPLELTNRIGVRASLPLLKRLRERLETIRRVGPQDPESPVATRPGG